MNETFPATPISVETFAQRLIALDTLRHAIVDLWEFWQRERNADGFSTADILRLEEIRQIVAAERPLLPASRETANQFKEILRSSGRPSCLSCDRSDPRIVSSLDPDGQTYIHHGAGWRVKCGIKGPLPQTESPREKSNDEHTASNSESRSNTVPASLTLPSIIEDGVRSPAKATHKTLSAGRSAPAARKAGRAVRGGGKKRRRGKRPSR